MKKVVFYISVIACATVLADVLLGLFSTYYVKHHAIPGDYETIDYLLKSVDEDILVLGSSIALNSTNPVCLTDSLHLSCWNGACNGQFLPYFETMLDCVLSHHHPQMVVLGLRPDELSMANKGTRYSMLQPYYKMGYEVLDEYLESDVKMQHLLLHSALYRYNTIWFRILLYHFISPGEKGEQGFIAKPMPRQFPVMRQRNSSPASKQGEVILQRMIDRCKDAGVQMAVYFPPTYEQIEQPIPALESAKQICRKNDIPCFDMAQDSIYWQHPEWYYDNAHLNIVGAQLFSAQLAHWLTSQKTKH